MNYYAHIAHILLHIIICMHTCRLVLDAYNFPISTVLLCCSTVVV